MPAATRAFPPDLSPPLTAATLIAGLRDSLIAAGFPPALKSYVVGTDQFVVWELISNPSKAYGRCYYRLKITAGLLCTHAIGTGWTDSTNTLGGASAESHGTTYLANVAVKLWGLRTEEYTILSVAQGALSQLLGIFRFTEAPAFDEASFPRVFIARTSDADSFSCTALTPYSSPIFVSSLGNAYMANADPFLSVRSQVSGVLLYGPSNGGVIARSSNDLAMGACSGMSRGDVFQVLDATPIVQYLLLKPGAGALLVRTT